MGEQWHHQVRVYLSDAMAEMVHVDRDNPALGPLWGVLGRHQAVPRSQYEAFAGYVAQAEREGPEGFPLYKWTKATLDDPVRRSAHATAFALHVAGQEVYSAEAADSLAADLQPLVGGGIVARMSRHDTNPANNMPVPAEYRS